MCLKKQLPCCADSCMVAAFHGAEAGLLTWLVPGISKHASSATGDGHRSVADDALALQLS